jgi:hypothetical protein
MGRDAVAPTLDLDEDLARRSPGIHNYRQAGHALPADNGNFYLGIGTRRDRHDGHNAAIREICSLYAAIG